MYEQAVLTMGILYFILGIITGLIVAVVAKSKIKKIGGAFIGGVSAAVFGLGFAVSITNLEAKSKNPMGISIVDLLPSVIVSIIGAVFVIYIIGLISGKSET